MPGGIKPFLRALAGETQMPVPFWFMRQAGRYLPEYRELRAKSSGFLNFCYTPDLAVEATLQPLRRFSPDAAILFSDILVIPDALGQMVDFREGEGPVLEPLKDPTDLDRLDPSKVCSHLAPVFETLRRLSQEIPQTTALIGFAGSPWTVATYMIEGRGGTDFSKARRWAENDAKRMDRLMAILIEATSAYLIEQVRNGAEALQLFDTWAGVLDEDGFRNWVIEPTAAIVARVKSEFPDIPIIGFPRGVGNRYGDFADLTGVDGLSLDAAIDPSVAARDLQPRCAVQGNLDPRLLIEGGAPMRQAAVNILQALSSGPFVFNLGHGITPDVPAAHVIELAKLISDWRPG
jgi:uroporphyrinogen decarboxylase